MIRIKDIHMGFHTSQDGNKLCIHYDRVDVILTFFIEETGKRMGGQFQVASAAIGYYMQNNMKEDLIGYIKVKANLLLEKYIKKRELKETKITDQFNKELHESISRCIDTFMVESNKPIKLCLSET